MAVSIQKLHNLAVPTLIVDISHKILYVNDFIEHRPHGFPQGLPTLPRNESTSEFMPVGDKEVEYFFASDASAVIEHTNRVIYLEVYFSIFL